MSTCGKPTTIERIIGLFPGPLISVTKPSPPRIDSCFVPFLLVYMINLIEDLDNPFDYSTHGESGTEVSLKPIHDLISRVSEDKK
jgi:hypothetical protein